VSDELRVQSILASLLLLVGVVTLLIAVVLAVWTTEGWPKLTLAALALLVAGGILAARNMRIPS
jgi:hypothetical protein